MTRVVVFISSLLFAGQLSGCTLTNPANTIPSGVDRHAEAKVALETLYSASSGAQALAKNAEGILIFPEITKPGVVIGGQYGKGVLFKGGQVAGYFNSSAPSYGSQAEHHRFGYVLFFMNPKDLEQLLRPEGWEIGAGDTVTIVDQTMRNSIPDAAKKGVYAIFFEQQGVMPPLGIAGTKISKSNSAG